MPLTPRRTLLVVALIALLALGLLVAGTLLRPPPVATFVREVAYSDSRLTCITLPAR